MKVRNILATKKGHTVTIGPDEPVHLAVGRLVEHHIGALVVLDDNGRLVGIVTERDIVRAASEDKQFLDRPVGDIMTRRIIVGMPQDDVISVAHTMLERRFRHLPIVDDDKLVGIISIGDVLKTQRDAYQGEVETLETQIIAQAKD